MHYDMKTGVRTRWMVRRDLRRVLTIEQRAFEFPWDRRTLVRCLRQSDVLGRVAVQGRHVLGFMVFDRELTQYRLLNLAVHDDCRWRGVGRCMVDWLMGLLQPSSQCIKPHHRSAIVLEVRETNLPAQLFFRALGFRATGLLHDFYEDTPEDAIRMEYRLPPGDV